MAQTEDQERRGSDRYIYGCEVTVAPAGTSDRHIARLFNLSSGGCLLGLDLPVALEQTMKVDLTLVSRDIAFRAVGSIRSRRDQGDHSTQLNVLFVTLGNRGRRDLEDLIAELGIKRVADQSAAPAS